MNIVLSNKPVQTNLTLLKGKNIQPQKASAVNFTGANPEVAEVASKSKFFKPITDFCHSAMDKLTDSIAKGCAKILKMKSFEKIILATEKAKIDVVKHLTAFISLIISGLYIYKTMTNDKLEPEKRTTLSINQGIVSVVATTLGYTFDKLANKKINKFIRKFAAVNVDEPALRTYQKGMRTAASMMIFGIMYRYVAPVLVTPIANHIGNKVQEKKEAKAKAALGTQASAPAPTPKSPFASASAFTKP